MPEQGAPRLTRVTAYQVVDGQRTGVTWSATLLGSGPQEFFGPLAPLVSVGEYDVVSEGAAVDRLNDPRFGATGGVMPLAVDDSARVAVPEGGADDDPASTSVLTEPGDGGQQSDTPAPRRCSRPAAPSRGR